MPFNIVEQPNAALIALRPGDSADHAVAGRDDLDPERRLPGQGPVPADRRHRHHRAAPGLGRPDPVRTDAPLAGTPEPALLPLAAGLRPGPGQHESAVLSIVADHPAGHRRGPGIHRTTGPGSTVFATPAGFRLDRPGGLRPLAAAAPRTSRCAARPPGHGPGIGRGPVLGAVHHLRPES